MYSCVSKLSCWAFSAPRNSDGSTEYARASGAAASVSPTSHELLVPSITDTPWLPPLSQFRTASTSFIKGLCPAKAAAPRSPFSSPSLNTKRMSLRSGGPARSARAASSTPATHAPQSLAPGPPGPES